MVKDPIIFIIRKYGQRTDEMTLARPGGADSPAPRDILLLSGRKIWHNKKTIETKAIM
jgi:hypothetical protein